MLRFRGVSNRLLWICLRGFVAVVFFAEFASCDLCQAELIPDAEKIFLGHCLLWNHCNVCYHRLWFLLLLILVWRRWMACSKYQLTMNIAHLFFGFLSLVCHANYQWSFHSFDNVGNHSHPSPWLSPGGRCVGGLRLKYGAKLLPRTDIHDVGDHLHPLPWLSSGGRCVGGLRLKYGAKLLPRTDALWCRLDTNS